MFGNHANFQCDFWGQYFSLAVHGGLAVCVFGRPPSLDGLKYFEILLTLTPRSPHGPKEVAIEELRLKNLAACFQEQLGAPWRRLGCCLTLSWL